MRIAILVCAYPPFKGGIGNAAAGHAGALVELGHEVDVLCPAHDSAPGTSAVDGVTVRRLRPVVSHGLSAFLPGLARRVGDYDGLLLEYPFFGGAEPAVLGARLSKIPYLVYFHMDVIWGGVRGAFLAVHRHIGAPWVLRGARQVLVSSFDYARHSSIAHLNLPNLCELPYSVDTHAFTPAAVSAERRRELGIDLERPVVLFVGTMNDAGTFKGVDRLLSAMAQGGLGERAQVVLAGEGNRRPGYMRMAAESLPEGSYRFTGGVSDDDLRDLYRAAAVTVLPSVTSEEAFGIVLIESMACGTPVVASALPGMRGVIGSDAGIAVPPGDVPRLARAISDVLDGIAVSDELARAARRRAVEVFSRERERADLGDAIARLRG